MLFLTEDPNPGREGDYQEFGSVYGRFTLGVNGAYRRASANDGVETVITVEDLLKAVAARR